MKPVGRFVATYRGQDGRSGTGNDYVPGQEYMVVLALGDGMIADLVVQSIDGTRPTIMYIDRDQFFKDWDSEQLQRVRARLKAQEQPKENYEQLPGPYFHIEVLTPFPGEWEPLINHWLHGCACALQAQGIRLYQREQLVPKTYQPNRLHYWVREDAERIVEYCLKRYTYAQCRILPQGPPAGG